MVRENEIKYFNDMCETAYNLVKLKGFPKITIGGRYYIPEEEFHEWIKDNTYSKILLKNYLLY